LPATTFTSSTKIVRSNGIDGVGNGGEEGGCGHGLGDSFANGVRFGVGASVGEDGATTVGGGRLMTAVGGGEAAVAGGGAVVAAAVADGGNRGRFLIESIISTIIDSIRSNDSFHFLAFIGVDQDRSDTTDVDPSGNEEIQKKLEG
jgi:hypothetical protein